jgi:C-terminal processing protease CtpA/Prc
VETVSGVGQGKEFRSVAGRWDEVRLGGIVLPGVPGGAGGVPLLGGEILRRFTVTFDFSRRRLLLEPNRHFGDGFPHDASGLNLRLAPENGLLRVHDVTPGSAAAKAGFKIEDLLLEVEGAPIEELGLERMHRLLENDGRTFRVRVRRGTEELSLTLVTAKIL